MLTLLDLVAWNLYHLWPLTDTDFLRSWTWICLSVPRLEWKNLQSVKKNFKCVSAL
uniref:Uncharacterized protein n=1 Tax=Anguilla anguilla TaxID=7936 RepID=A0A0E9XL70_ANGAN